MGARLTIQSHVNNQQMVLRRTREAGRTDENVIRSRKRSKGSSSLTNHNDLFSILSKPNADVHETSRRWLDTSSQCGSVQSLERITDIVNLILSSAGCLSQLNEHDTINYESANATVADLSSAFNAQRVHEVLYSSKDRNLRFLRDQIDEFFRRMIQHAHDSGSLYEEADLESSDSASISPFAMALLSWINALCTSSARPLRMVATSIFLCVISQLITTFTSIETAIESMSRQLERTTVLGGKRARLYRARHEQMENNVRLLKQRKYALLLVVKENLSEVFVQRFRDVESKIRIECVSALGAWVTLNPHFFIRDKYLRFIGWSLSDPKLQVQEESTKSMAKIIKTGAKDITLRQELRQFADAYKTQMGNMLWTCESKVIKRSLVSIFLDLLRAGLLNASECEEIVLHSVDQIENQTSKDALQELSKFIAALATKRTVEKLEYHTHFLANYTATNIESALGFLDIETCVKFKSLSSILKVAFEHYEQKRISSTERPTRSSFMENVFSEIYKLPEYLRSIKSLVLFLLTDFSATRFISNDSRVDATDQPEGIKVLKLLDIDSEATRVSLLMFLSGAVKAIIEECSDSIELVNNESLAFLVRHLSTLQLHSHGKSVSAFVSLINRIAVRQPSLMLEINLKLNMIQKYKQVHSRIISDFADFEDLDDESELTFESYFSLFLAHFLCSKRSLLGASSTLEIQRSLEAALGKLHWQIDELLGLMNLPENFASLTENDVQHRQILILSRLSNSFNGLRKMNIVGRFVNISKIMTEIGLSHHRGTLQLIETNILRDLDISLIVSRASEDLEMVLNAVRRNWSTIFGLYSVFLCWKLQELTSAAADESAHAIDVSVYLDDFKTLLCNIGNHLKALGQSIGDTLDNSLDDRKRIMLEELCGWHTETASAFIDCCVPLRVFYYKFRIAKPFAGFEKFFEDPEISGPFLGEVIPKSIQKQLLLAFLTQEASLANSIGVTLEREPEENVNLYDLVFDMNSKLSGGSFPEVTSGECYTVDSSSLQWPAERRLGGFLIKILCLVQSGGIAGDFERRIGLNLLKLGRFFTDILDYGKDVASTKSAELLSEST